jgi:DNA-binding transcriptional MerR regulator
MMAAEKAQAERAAIAKVATDLGVSVEDAKTIIKERHDADAARLSEAEKSAQAAAKDKADAEKLKAEAAADRHAAKVERALIAAGGNVKTARMIDLQPGATDDEIKTAVEALKTEIPALFTTTGEAPAAGDGQNPNPQPPARGTAPKAPFGGKGLERARRDGLIKPETTPAA